MNGIVAAGHFLSQRRFQPSFFLRPMPVQVFVSCAIAAFIFGTLYCSFYHSLLKGFPYWTGSLIWSFHTVLPWLVLIEFIKRREWEADRLLPLLNIAGLMLFTLVAAATAHVVVYEALIGEHNAPVGWQLLRRIPAAGITGFLIMLSRRERQLARKRCSAAPETAAGDMEALRLNARRILWIKAADNYLECHFPDETWTRRLTMREAEEVLAPLGFIRIHRSLIVNRAFVKAVIPQSRRPAVLMTDGTYHPTGKAFSANLMTRP